jgi:hypothetical protein
LPVVKVRVFPVCMKKIITTSCLSLSFFALFAILGSQTSCQKETTNCTAVVTVKDSNSNPVADAAVKLYAPHGQVQGNGHTNASGTVSFTFTLPAIFNIAATYAIGPNDTLKGSGIIQLQIGQTVSSSVTVK